MESLRSTLFRIICYPPKFTQVTAFNSPIETYLIFPSLSQPRSQNKQSFTFQKWFQLQASGLESGHKRAWELSFPVWYCSLQLEVRALPRHEPIRRTPPSLSTLRAKFQDHQTSRTLGLTSAQVKGAVCVLAPCCSLLHFTLAGPSVLSFCGSQPHVQEDEWS